MGDIKLKKPGLGYLEFVNSLRKVNSAVGSSGDGAGRSCLGRMVTRSVKERIILIIINIIIIL